MDLRFWNVERSVRLRVAKKYDPRSVKNQSRSSPNNISRCLTKTISRSDFFSLQHWCERGDGCTGLVLVVRYWQPCSATNATGSRPLWKTTGIFSTSIRSCCRLLLRLPDLGTLRLRLRVTGSGDSFTSSGPPFSVFITSACGPRRKVRQAGAPSWPGCLEWSSSGMWVGGG